MKVKAKPAAAINITRFIFRIRWKVRETTDLQHMFCASSRKSRLNLSFRTFARFDLPKASSTRSQLRHHIAVTNHPDQHRREKLVAQIETDVGSFRTNHASGPSDVRKLELPVETEGFLISHVATGSNGYLEGLAAGMAIIWMNGHAVRTLGDYRRIRSKMESRKQVLLLVQSDEASISSW